MNGPPLCEWCDKPAVIAWQMWVNHEPQPVMGCVDHYRSHEGAVVGFFWQDHWIVDRSHPELFTQIRELPGTVAATSNEALRIDMGSTLLSSTPQDSPCPDCRHTYSQHELRWGVGDKGYLVCTACSCGIKLGYRQLQPEPPWT